MQTSSTPPVALAGILTVHHWPAFLTVVCLGLIQITVTYYGGTLSIDSLPSHIPEARRRRHRRVFAWLFLIFVVLTLSLAKLNDSNQHRADLAVQQATAKQATLQAQLGETLNAVLDSQSNLQRIRQLVDAHPAGAERSMMLSTLDDVQQNLHQQENSMRQVITR